MKFSKPIFDERMEFLWVDFPHKQNGNKSFGKIWNRALIIVFWQNVPMQDQTLEAAF